MYILDTNVISELRKVGDGRADPNVVKWIDQKDSELFFLSAVTIMELEIGIRRAERADPKKGAALRSWMSNHVIPEFTGRILPFDFEAAMICADLHVPDPKSDRDAMIAATAFRHKMTIATRNTRDFEQTKVKIVNPWQE